VHRRKLAHAYLDSPIFLAHLYSLIFSHFNLYQFEARARAASSSLFHLFLFLFLFEEHREKAFRGSSGGSGGAAVLVRGVFGGECDAFGYDIRRGCGCGQELELKLGRSWS